MAAVGVLSTVPWLMSMLGKIPGATGSYARFADWCAQELQAKRAVSNFIVQSPGPLADFIQDREQEQRKLQGTRPERCHLLVTEG